MVAAIMAASSSLIYYSQEARAYTLLVLLVTISAGSLLFYAQRVRDPAARPTRYLVLFVGCATLTLYTHFVGWFWALPAFVVLRLCVGRGGTEAQIRTVLVAIALFTALAIPEAVRVLAYAMSPADGFHWLRQASPLGFLATVGKVLLPLQPISPRLNESVCAALTGIVLTGVGCAAYRARVASPRLRDMAAPTMVIAVLLLQPLAVWLFGFVVRPIFLDRTMLTAVPGFALLLALTFRSRPTMAGAVISLYALAVLIGGSYHLKEDWTGVVAAVRSTASDRKHPIIVCAHWYVPAFREAAENRGFEGATLLAPVGRTMVRMSADLGADKDWPSSYATQVIARTVPAYRENHHRNFPPGEQVMVDGASLISANCSAGKRADIMRWLGPGQLTQVWHSAPRDDSQLLSVEQFTSTFPGLRQTAALSGLGGQPHSR
jgi:hypothetical protein